MMRKVCSDGSPIILLMRTTVGEISEVILVLSTGSKISQPIGTTKMGTMSSGS